MDLSQIRQKLTLSYEEAAFYSGIGENKLRALCACNPELILKNGSHSRVKRMALERFIENHGEI